MKNRLRSEIDQKDKWDLTRIYQNEKAFNQDYEKAKTLLEELTAYEGKIMTSSNSLYETLELERKLDEILTKLFIHANLYYYEDMKNNDADSLRIKIDSLADDVSSKTAFILPEMLQTDYKKFVAENEKLKKYEFSLEKMYRFKEYTLSDVEEKLLAKVSSVLGTGGTSYSKLNNADIDLGYIKDENGKKVRFNTQLYTDMIHGSDRPTRKRAFAKMYDYYISKKYTISSLYISTIKENVLFSSLRGYDSALERSLYKDNVTTSVYKNLIETTHRNLPSVHKYMDVKKKMIGVSKMHMYDTYTEPVFETKEHIEFEDAQKLITEALKPLGTTYVSDLQKAFTEGWIDKYPNEGKRSGAYQWGPYKTPFVSVNYNYKIDDVSTLAHELGHAMHTYYSDHNQSTIYNNYPIFLAEIASTVNEALLSDYLLKNAKSKEDKIKYISEFLEKTRATIYRQVMFAEFEMLVHEMEEEKTPLTQESLCKVYYDLNKLYFGPNVVSDDYIQYEWMRIPHFHRPFYVYKYATGLASALALATDIINEVPNAQERYLDFLKSGCSKYPLETLKDAGVDLESGETIEKAFELFNQRVEELNDLINE